MTVGCTTSQALLNTFTPLIWELRSSARAIHPKRRLLFFQAEEAPGLKQTRCRATASHAVT